VKPAPQASSTPSKLYVSNLSQAATLSSMRELFGTCGDVLKVEFAAERGSPRLPSAAYVTMASPLAADRAVTDLHGRLHCDRVLVISRMLGETTTFSDHSRPARRAPAVARVAMTQQYRDRHASTYELSCSGKLLTLRFVFPLDDAHGWHVEARMVPGPAVAVTAGAMTREQAFRALVGAWTAADSEETPSDLDWEEVAVVLRAVRAL
jgi:hypothetical protein